MTYLLLPRTTPPNSPEISSRPVRKSSSTKSGNVVGKNSATSRSPSLWSSSSSDMAAKQPPATQQGTSGAKRGRSRPVQAPDSSSDSQDPARYIKSSMKADAAEKKAKIDRKRARKLVHEFNYGPLPVPGRDTVENLKRESHAAVIESDKANDIAASSRALAKVYQTAGRYSRGAGEIERAQINENKAEIARKTGSMWSSEHRRAKISSSSLKMVVHAWDKYQGGEEGGRAQYSMDRIMALEYGDKAVRHGGKARKKSLEVERMEENFGRFSDGDQSLIGHPEDYFSSMSDNSRPSTPESMSSVGKPESLSDTSSSARKSA